MEGKPYTKLIRENDYVAEVDVHLTEDGPWGPTMSKDDAFKIDDVREALRRGDLRKAASMARVYRLTPVDTEAA